MAELLKDLPLGARIDGQFVYGANDEILGRVSEYDTSPLLAGSPTNDWTWGDIKRQNQRNAKEVGAVGAAGALASLAQIGLNEIPTATDTRNADRTKVLQGMERTGTMGLTADERSQAEATVLTPARQLAREAQERTAARLASAPTSSLATQAAFAQANEKAAQDAAVKGGIAINQANIEAKARQTAELESRLREKGQQDADRRDQVIGAIGDIAKMGGKLAAAQVQQRGLSDKDVSFMSTAKNDDGSPKYPWAVGKSPEEIRRAAERQKAYDIYGAQADAKAAKKQTSLSTSTPDIGAFPEDSTLD